MSTLGRGLKSGARGGIVSALKLGFVCFLLSDDLAFTAKGMVLLTFTHIYSQLNIPPLLPPSFLKQEGGFVWVHSRFASEGATRLKPPGLEKQKDWSSAWSSGYHTGWKIRNSTV